MIIKGVRLRASTATGEFGFAKQFGRNLTIIRGNNTGGKSTLFNSLLFALGMEELVGGRNEKSLPSAVKQYLLDRNGNRQAITGSEVRVAIENARGDVVTFRRAIFSEDRSPKLIEVLDGDQSQNTSVHGRVRPLYIHDSGAAKSESGFHRYLEKFIGLSLPTVASTDGDTTQLYLQTVFSGLIVEQKRGWTDYLANVPFLGIKDARARAVEFLLGLNVFATAARRAELDAQSHSIKAEWRIAHDELIAQCAGCAVEARGLPTMPTALFRPEQVELFKSHGTDDAPLREYVLKLRAQHHNISSQRSSTDSASRTPAQVRQLEELTAQLQTLGVLHGRTTATISELSAAKDNYEELLKEVADDLAQNKAAEKLSALGAQVELRIASGHCPTCGQAVSDNLLQSDSPIPFMSLAENVAHLNSQYRMLVSQVAGTKERLEIQLRHRTSLARKIEQTHDQLAAIRNEVSSGMQDGKASLRQLVEIEQELAQVSRLELYVQGKLETLQRIASDFSTNEAAKKTLPRTRFAPKDEDTIRTFGEQFRRNADNFGYTSAATSDIEIPHSLVPTLANIELRQLQRTVPQNDVRSDSSASDFVRLIWSYIISIYQTASKQSPSNHPGFLMMDEPGQHSMSVASQHALFKCLASQSGLQSIIAASFDESDDVFATATRGLEFALIEWDGKLLQPTP